MIEISENNYCEQLTLISNCLKNCNHDKLSTHSSVNNIKKRIIDILGALIGLIFTMLIFLPISVVMIISDPGPVFYSQIRCGLHGKPFRIWKFRTMIVGADKQQHTIKNEAKGNIFKNKNDPRITKIGKFLRRTSLDEIPQFWNVLKGEMSLVGTRPPTIKEVKNYSPHHWKRLEVKPGITGEWQTSGRSLVYDFEKVVEMDIDYQKRWSIFYDLTLIIKTIAIVFGQHGSY